MNFQMMVSCTPDVSCTRDTSVHRRRYPVRCVTDEPCCWMRFKSRTHVWFVMACCSDLFFLPEILKSLGATSLGLCPSIQPLSQKDVLLLSPIMIFVAAANNLRSACEHGTSLGSHRLSSFIHWYHSHLSRSALENFRRAAHLGLPFS